MYNRINLSAGAIMIDMSFRLLGCCKKPWKQNMSKTFVNLTFSMSSLEKRKYSLCKSWEKLTANEQSGPSLWKAAQKRDIGHCLSLSFGYFSLSVSDRKITHCHGGPSIFVSRLLLENSILRVWGETLWWLINSILVCVWVDVCFGLYVFVCVW